MAASGPLPKAVVFDLDGTLVDSAPDIARAMNAAFSPLGVPQFPVDAIHGFIGAGAPVAIERAAKAAGVTLEPGKREEMMQRFFAAYREVSAEGNGIFDGAHELLSGLRSDGWRLGLCTNKAEDVNHIAVRALRIDGYFGSIEGAREGRPKKPDPAMLHAVLERLSVRPSEAVMIGDSHIDLDVARAVGARAVLVSFGYCREPVRGLGADAVVDNLLEVPAVLAKLFD
jgi:phosphoglycolate phosphatase